MKQNEKTKGKKKRDTYVSLPFITKPNLFFYQFDIDCQFDIVAYSQAAIIENFVP